MSGFQASRAIVIGINDYQHGIPKLQTAVNDAERLAEILAQDYGYDVDLLVEDVTMARLAAHFQAARDKICKDDRLLIYFAGHGIALDGDDGPAGYLVPQDAHLEDRDTFLPMTELHCWLEALPARHLLAILDCCFAGAFRWASTRALVPVPEVIHKERYDRFIRDAAWQVITSAAYDQTALDQLAGDAKRGVAQEEGLAHSPFARALFEALAGAGDVVPRGEGDGVITATELYLYLRDEVEVRAEEQASHSQTPGLWPLNKHDKGEYIFLVPGHELNLPPAPELSGGNNPYRGLQSYDEEHCQLFFGREQEIEEMAALVANQPFAAVLGASGTGKSSLVKAGLLPRLGGCAEDGEPAEGPEAAWFILPPLRPTATPLLALQQVLGRALPRPVSVPDVEALRTNTAALADLVAAWHRHHPGGHFLLVVDQLEELITLCRDDGERDQFLALLAAAVEQNPDTFRLVVTLRTDFELQLAQDTALAGPWARDGARYVVPPMDHDDLRAVIEGPASVRVLYFEPYGLVDELIKEVIQTPGALPLLSFTLSELYIKYLERQAAARMAGETVDRSLTEADYQALGGVLGSLRNRATEEYEDLPDDAHRETMRRVMLRMVAVEGGEVARRRVPRSELVYPDEGENQRVGTVIQRLVAARLLVEGSEEDGAAYVEPAHDALVRAWDKLLAWKAGAEEYLPLQRRLGQAAAEWDRAGEKDRKGLLWDDDPRLPQVEDIVWPAGNGRRGPVGRVRWLKHVILPDVAHLGDTSWLNRREVVFVQKSVSRRASVLRRIAIITLAVMAVLAVLTLFAFRQQAIAQRNADQLAVANDNLEVERDNALRQSRIARARELAARAQLSLEESPPRTLLLAAEAVRITQGIDGLALTEPEQVLWDANVSAGGIPLHGHEAEVIAVALSHNDRWLATASWDNTARLWDMSEQDADPMVLAGHEDVVNAVAFSYDDRWLVTASDDGTARLWDVVDPGAEPIVLRGHEDVVNDAAFSPDDRWLATASDDGTARLWDLADPSAESLVLAGHESWVNSLAFSPDDRWLATASDDGTARLWDLEDPNAEPAVLDSSNEYLLDIGFSPDGRWVAAVGGSGSNVDLWELEGMEAVPFVLEGHIGDAYVLAFSGDSRWLATAGSAGAVRLWDLEDPDAESIILAVRDLSKGGIVEDIPAVAFSPDDRQVAAGSQDGTVRLWDMDDPFDDPLILYGHEGRVTDLAFSYDGEWLVSSSYDDTARLWELQNPGIEPRVLDLATAVLSVDVSPNARWLAAGSSDGATRLWDPGTLDVEPIVLAGDHDVESMAFSPDGRLLATGDHDGAVKVWELDDLGRDPLVLDAHDGRVTGIDFSPDGRWLATGGEDETALLWDLQSPGAEPESFDSASGETAVAFSMDSRWLAMTYETLGDVLLWDLQNLDDAPTVLEGHNDLVKDLAFSHDSQRLATASYDGTTEVWDLRDLESEPLVLRGYTNWVLSVSFSSDDRWLATAGLDGTTRLWDLENPGVESLILRGHADAVNDAAFSPDDLWLSTASEDGTVRLWTRSTDHLLETSCRTAGRNLTQGEWNRYFPDEPYRKTCPDLPNHPSVLVAGEGEVP